jgi:flagellar motor switch protein FliG
MKRDVSSLAGPQKAAALLLAMGKPAATQLLKHFSHQELREVTAAAARLGTVQNAELDAIVEDFTAAFSAGVPLLGDEGQTRAMLSDAVPAEQIADMLSEVLGGHGPDVWKSIANLPEALLSSFLKGEHPLTATYILSKLDAALSARVVALLPRDMRNQVLCRLLSPPSVVPGALEMFESAISEALLGSSANAGGEDNRVRIAEIINSLDPTEAEDVMKALSANRPQDARVVRTMLFSFNDLPRLTQRARALLFDKVSTESVVLALRGTDADFREPVLSAMAARSRRLVESELASPSSTPAAETEKARRQIVKLVLVMAQRGEIELPTADGEGEIGADAA